MAAVPVDSIKKALEDGDFSKLPFFTFEGVLTLAKVVDVYDGDTITVVFMHENRPVKYHMRMSGYDSPEMRPPLSLPDREIFIKAATVVRDHVRASLVGRVVWVKFEHEEKYGRLMGRVYVPRDGSADFDESLPCVNDEMIKLGYGKPYKGGTKNPYNSREVSLIAASTNQ